jgi:AcrR family transcriptional regulator
VGRPAKYTREQLQAAALAIVDAQGLAGLSMRSLAAALGTGPMTLYNHVADRADLEVLVAEAVLAAAPGRRSRRRRGWRAEVLRVATAMWAPCAHPHAIPLILTRRSRSWRRSTWPRSCWRPWRAAGARARRCSWPSAR